MKDGGNGRAFHGIVIWSSFQSFNAVCFVSILITVSLAYDRYNATLIEACLISAQDIGFITVPYVSELQQASQIRLLISGAGYRNDTPFSRISDSVLSSGNRSPRTTVRGRLSRLVVLPMYRRRLIINIRECIYRYLLSICALWRRILKLCHDMKDPVDPIPAGP